MESGSDLRHGGMDGVVAWQARQEVRWWTTMSFKKKSAEERAAECRKVCHRFPGRHPVVLQKAPFSALNHVPKSRYLVPENALLTALVPSIRSKVLPESASRAGEAAGSGIMLLCRGGPLPLTANVQEVYAQHHDADGFLYLMYATAEETEDPLLRSALHLRCGARDLFQLVLQHRWHAWQRRPAPDTEPAAPAAPELPSPTSLPPLLPAPSEGSWPESQGSDTKTPPTSSSRSVPDLLKPSGTAVEEAAAAVQGLVGRAAEMQLQSPVEVTPWEEYREQLEEIAAADIVAKADRAAYAQYLESRSRRLADHHTEYLRRLRHQWHALQDRQASEQLLAADQQSVLQSVAASLQDQLISLEGQEAELRSRQEERSIAEYSPAVGDLAAKQQRMAAALQRATASVLEAMELWEDYAQCLAANAAARAEERRLLAAQRDAERRWEEVRRHQTDVRATKEALEAKLADLHRQTTSRLQAMHETEQQLLQHWQAAYQEQCALRDREMEALARSIREKKAWLDRLEEDLRRKEAALEEGPPWLSTAALVADVVDLERQRDELQRRVASRLQALTGWVDQQTAQQEEFAEMLRRCVRARRSAKAPTASPVDASPPEESLALSVPAPAEQAIDVVEVPEPAVVASVDTAEPAPQPPALNLDPEVPPEASQDVAGEELGRQDESPPPQPDEQTVALTTTPTQRSAPGEEPAAAPMCESLQFSDAGSPEDTSESAAATSSGVGPEDDPEGDVGEAAARPQPDRGTPAGGLQDLDDFSGDDTDDEFEEIFSEPLR
eukprot:EG_transcript_1588